MLEERKWAKDAQRGRNGPRKPMSNGMGKEGPKQHKCKPNDNTGPL